MLLCSVSFLVNLSKFLAKVRSRSDATPINLRCLSDPNFFCTFADVKIGLIKSPTTMDKKIWSKLAELFRLLAALLAGIAGGVIS